MRQPPTRPNGTIRVVLPAHPDFLTGLRVMARTAAALSDLSVDDIEEMQMAVDEAATLLLPLASDSSQQLTATFAVSPTRMHARLSIPCLPGTRVDRHSLGWLMLTGLDPDVRVSDDDSVASIAVARSARHG